MMDIVSAKKALKEKKISSVELTKSYISSIEAKDKNINAVLECCFDLALYTAKRADEMIAKGEAGLLTGIPYILKDNMVTVEAPTTCASKILEGFLSPYDATVYKILKSQNAVMLAKANMDEFAMGSSTENSAYAITKNPWDLTRVPGGSSGGSAAAVAADECVFALGSDTGGSIRQPAAYCGVVGVKPTYGSVSRYGLVAFASSLDQIGPLAKTVTDAGEILNVICGKDDLDSTSVKSDIENYLSEIDQGVKGKRIALPDEFFKGLGGEMKAVIEKAANLLEQAGAVVERCSLKTFDYALSAYYIISSAEATSNLSRFDGVKYGPRADASGIKDVYYHTRGAFFGAEVKRRIMLGNYVLSSGYYDAFYLKALKARTLIKQDYDELYKKYDLILSPVTAAPAFKIGEKSDPVEMYLTDIYTVPVNIAGLPAISLPVDKINGLPAAVQLIAPPFGERTMLAAAKVIEDACAFKREGLE